MHLPRVDPIGVTHYPHVYRVRAPRPAWVRALAALVLTLFGLVAVVSTVRSLGAYCVTTDGPDFSQAAGR